MTTEMIPFQIEAQRVIELFATQIYQSPLALLRENTQNAFDAIKLRWHQRADFEPRIDITLQPDSIAIADNGIGMTPEELSQNYWKAGSSSKNTNEARAAGVVGTFGIGAMANFGISDMLSVETESAITGERSISCAEKAKLSLQENCIQLSRVSPTGAPGTKVIARIAPGTRIDIAQARSYISEFLSLVDLPVYVNGTLISQQSIETAVQVVPEAWNYVRAAEQIGPRLRSDVTLVMSNNGEIWLKLSNIYWANKAIQGRIVLRSGTSVLKTFRNGFGLATASVISVYKFGGVIDLLTLEPTAGREALTVNSLQLIQSMMSEIDAYASLRISERDECDSSTPFINWAVSNRRIDLCCRIKMSIFPGDRISLGEIQHRTQTKPMLLYEGNDQAVITLHATEETPLLVLARSNPRRQCEQMFLNNFCKVERISDNPVVLRRKQTDELSFAESALLFRIESIIDTDYFLKSDVTFGTITHGLPILAEKKDDRVLITLNPDGQTIRLLLNLYETEFTAFSGMAKDFVRTAIFPRISNYVPSSTRQGAEAFLKAIRKSRELFEYADDDLGNLAKIWDDYKQGLISVGQMIDQSQHVSRVSIQVVDARAAIKVSDVVPDIIQNEQVLQAAEPVETSLNLEPAPAITRLETQSAAKLLIIDDNEPALRDYRCFLAITDRAREEMGDFFIQPHRTSIVWGGQKTLFIFLHQSGEFGLYYDLQTREPIDAISGGGPYPTSTIVLKNRIFIPIPNEISASFLPNAGERKRFEVRADILRIDSSND